MKVLLDTNALIWFAEGNNRLSIKAKSEIEDLDNKRFVSTVSLWEIAIKSSINKLELKKSFKEIYQFSYENDINLITVQVAHLHTLLTLERYHSDPFDRLPISQAITENMAIITVDKQFGVYPISVVW